MDGLTLADLLTLAGNAVVVAVLVELVKRTLSLTDEAIDRFAPVLACASGTAIALAAAAYLNATQGNGGDLAQAGLTGFLAGALASGIYSVAGAKVGEIVSSLSGGRL